MASRQLLTCLTLFVLLSLFSETMTSSIRRHVNDPSFLEARVMRASRHLKRQHEAVQLPANLDASIAQLEANVEETIAQLPTNPDAPIVAQLPVFPLSGAGGHEGSLRLVNTANPGDTSTGRLEIFHNGQWGTICDDYFDYKAARIACSALGFARGRPVRPHTFGAGSDPIWLDNIQCTGTEGSVADCPHNNWSQNDCTHDEDVALQCREADSSGITEGSLRVGGSSEGTSGLLEIYHDGEWGGICNRNGFRRNAANIACKSLNHKSGIAQDTTSSAGPGGPSASIGTAWLQEVQCQGTETSIVDCQHSEFEHANCYRGLVSVTCSGDENAREAEDGAIRLVNTVNPTDNSAGRVEIYHEGEWGTVCDDAFTSKAATIVCAKFGYSRGRTLQQGIMEPGSGVIWLDQVTCVGTERSIVDCPHNPWEQHDCSHYEDVGVKCRNPDQNSAIAESTLRLGPSGGESTGLLEIFHDGEWGAICSRKFTRVDAVVACRNLNFKSGVVLANDNDRPGRPAEVTWLSDVECDGTEGNIADCRHSDWEAECHYGSVSLQCSGDEHVAEAAENTLRLVNTLNENKSSGRLEIYHAGEWGTVCDDGFDNNDATAACRGLGYRYGQFPYDGRSNPYGPGTGQIWLDDLQCTGSEQHIADCQSNGWGEHNCGHGEDTAIDCSNEVVRPPPNNNGGYDDNSVIYSGDDSRNVYYADGSQSNSGYNNNDANGYGSGSLTNLNNNNDNNDDNGLVNLVASNNENNNGFDNSQFNPDDYSNDGPSDGGSDQRGPSGDGDDEQ